MRHLILHRQRALIGFALKYYCIMGGDREAFMKSLAWEKAAALAGESRHRALRNGETITVELPQAGGSFFVAVFLEDRSIVTDPVVIGPGEADAEYVILTDRAPYKGMGIALAKVEQQPGEAL